MIGKLRSFIAGLREEARTHSMALSEKYEGEWAYHDHDRHTMAVEQRLLQRIAKDLETAFDIQSSGEKANEA